MRDRLEANASIAHPVNRAPVEGEAGRRRFEGQRQRRNRRPHIPEREGIGHMRVLDRATVAAETGPDVLPRAIKANRDEPWVVEEALDGRDQRAKGQPIARMERRRQRPIFGWDPIVYPHPNTTALKRTSPAAWSKTGSGGQGPIRASRTSMLPAGSEVHALQAGRNSGGVVGDDEIPRAEKLDEVRPRRVSNRSVRVHDEKPRGRGTLNGSDSQESPMRLLHVRMFDRPAEAAEAPRPQSRRSTGPRQPAPRALTGSASGSASACSGVSMSPGSIDRTCTPSAASSAFQIRLIW